jgi:hypothetical protein
LRSRDTGSGKEEMKFSVAWMVKEDPELTAGATMVSAADAARAIAAAAAKIPKVFWDLLPEGTWIAGVRVGHGEEPAPGEECWSAEVPSKGLWISVERVTPEGIPLSFPPKEYGYLPMFLRGIHRVFPEAEITRTAGAGNPEGGPPWLLALGEGRRGQVFSDIPLLTAYVEGFYDAMVHTRLI